jgi:hypothetical protein
VEGQENTRKKILRKVHTYIKIPSGKRQEEVTEEEDCKDS